MWLVYLRFDGKNQTKVTHVLCGNQKHAVQIVENARQFGSSQETPLVEYKLFYSHATIKSKDTLPDPLAHAISELAKKNSTHNS